MIDERIVIGRKINKITKELTGEELFSELSDDENKP